MAVLIVSCSDESVESGKGFGVKHETGNILRHDDGCVECKGSS